jgi:hypothetical protein
LRISNSFRNKVKMLLSFYIIFLIQYIVHGLNHSPTDCLIKNEKYQFEYLYAASDEDDALINKNYKVHESLNDEEKIIEKKTNFENEDDNNNSINMIYVSRQAYVYPLGLIYDYDLIKWSIIPISTPKNQTFYIRNKLNNQYLCASQSHTNSFFKTRRKVFTHSIVDHLDQRPECMWKFEKFQNKMKLFIIWNVKYSEALYAAGSLFYDMELGRNVYTWHKKPDSNQFYWNLHCMK